MTDQQEKMREEFEGPYNPAYLSRRENGEYINQGIQLEWRQFLRGVAAARTKQSKSAEKIARLEAERKWQPIETAPNEYGIDVWIVSLDNPEFGVRVPNVHRVSARWFGIPDYYLTDRVFPAYWMPLPPAPDKE